jgi:hypothetical protein
MTASRRPLLKIVDRSTNPPPEGQTTLRHVQHDARGNAVWSVPVNLEDTGDLVLEPEALPQPRSDGDPYNRGPLHTRPKS